MLTAVLHFIFNSFSVNFFYFLGPLWAIFEVEEKFKNCFGVYSFSWTIFILYIFVNSDIWFYLILGSFFTFWGPNGLFLGFRYDSSTVLGSNYVAKQLSFSMIPSILTLDFDFILRTFLLFGAIVGYFWGWGWGRAQKLFRGLLM